MSTEIGSMEYGLEFADCDDPEGVMCINQFILEVCMYKITS